MVCNADPVERAKKVSSQLPVVRNANWIEREYGREKWPAVLAQINAAIAAGETDLSRVLSCVKRWELALTEERQRAFVVSDRLLELPHSFGMHGGWGMISEKLLSLAQGADTIIELGSGWGYNLFHLWLNGGPRDARYIALEYTEAGQICTKRLANLQRNLALTTLPFDYYNVDLRALGRFEGRVLVFSYFSIDQIPHLSADIYRQLRKLSSNVAGVHFEPAGWQMDGDGCVGSSFAYAIKHDYNRNLWVLLNELQDEGLLRIEVQIPSYFGQNPQNSASMICWTMDN